MGRPTPAPVAEEGNVEPAGGAAAALLPPVWRAFSVLGAGGAGFCWGGASRDRVLAVAGAAVGRPEPGTALVRREVLVAALLVLFVVEAVGLRVRPYTVDGPTV